MLTNLRGFKSKKESLLRNLQIYEGYRKACKLAFLSKIGSLYCVLCVFIHPCIHIHMSCQAAVTQPTDAIQYQACVTAPGLVSGQSCSSFKILDFPSTKLAKYSSPLLSWKLVINIKNNSISFYLCLRYPNRNNAFAWSTSDIQILCTSFGK